MSWEFVVRWIESFGALDVGASTALAAIFVIGAFLPFPRTLLVVGAGAAFGLGSLAVIVPSSALGSILAFLLARGLLRNWVQRQADNRPYWKIVAQAVNDEGWRIIALMRLWGPLPNAAQNYLFGLTSVGLLPYSLITLIFAFPQTVAYAYLGASGRSVLLYDGSSTLNLLWMGMAVIIVLAIIFLISRRVRIILGMGSRGVRIYDGQT
jgi:uncharacterized membrane protein YdjX (TVP38/TMEM64 family)